MLWLMIIVGVVVIVGGILGGMGFFGPSDTPDHRHTGVSRFFDWMM